MSINKRYINQTERATNVTDYIIGYDSDEPIKIKNFSKLLLNQSIKVGTGGDFNTIQEALTEGHRSLNIISDITEDTDWGSDTGGAIRIFCTDERYKVTFTVANSNVSPSNPRYIIADNIEIAVTGTATIFGNYNNFYFGDVKLPGNNENNVFLDGVGSIIDADKLDIDTGTAGTFIIKYLRNINILKLSGTTTGNTGIQTQGGTINRLEVSGAFSGTNYINSRFLGLNQTIVNYMVDESTGNIGVLMASQSKILGGNVRYIYVATTTGTLIENLTVDEAINNPTEKMRHCNINRISSLNIDIQDIEIIINNFSFSGDNKNITNCRFPEDLTVTGDNNIFTNCRIGADLINEGSNNIFVNCDADSIENKSTADYSIFDNCTYITSETDNSSINIFSASDIASISDFGNGFCEILTTSEHDLKNDYNLTLADTTNYNGTYKITINTTKSFIIEATYVAETTSAWTATGSSARKYDVYQN